MIRRIMLAAVLLSGCAATHDPLPVVDTVDLARYRGLWHEIARLPNRFQTGCTKTTASYRQVAPDRLEVINRCLKDGEADTAEGVAWVEGPEAAKLRVRFFWPFSGRYWIIALDEDYQWAMVAEPGRDYLWILAREPELDNRVLEGLVARAAQLGFDTERLIYAQP